MKMPYCTVVCSYYKYEIIPSWAKDFDLLNSLLIVILIIIIEGDYDGALGVLTEMEYLAQERGSSGQGGRPIGAFSDVLANCQVSRVLLLMLLQVNFNVSNIVFTDLPHLK